MKIRTMGYFFKESLISLRRNGWMSFASILTVAISLFVCGIFWLLVLNVNNVADSIESSVEIKAFLHDNTRLDQIEIIEKQIRALPGVSEVDFVSRDEALESLRKQFGEKNDLLDALEGENPLPDSFTVKTKTAEDVIPVAQSMEQTNLFEKVRYGQGVVEKLFALINWIRLLGVGIMTLLGIAAVVLIAITIRLTVYARRKEITIMKYVGATDWFIRWPFLLEGVFLGLIGSFVAVMILFWSYSSLVKNVSVSLSFIQLIREPGLLWNINAGLMLTGTALGALGSMISLHKFLKV
ncbi:cell division protein FtsX [Candidatus Formimonas warabiya]|uniref:Cell division protein FtsX n=2 Tax=Formimonas warabiya TaxID=1761012 RepID=A0A3G1KTY5_FORW1|nr:cell division protein FtsX [Candidatus Formimonas warabiya]